MKLCHLTLLLCVSLSLTGCSALLERNYATVEPHSSKSVSYTHLTLPTNREV